MIGVASSNAYADRRLENLKKYAEIAHKQGAKSIVQLAHAGIRADHRMTNGFDVVGPTTELYSGARGLTEQEVLELIDSFAYAAELILRVGHDGVKSHGANGWLIHGGKR